LPAALKISPSVARESIEFASRAARLSYSEISDSKVIIGTASRAASGHTILPCPPEAFLTSI